MEFFFFGGGGGGGGGCDMNFCFLPLGMCLNFLFFSWWVISCAETSIGKPAH